MQREKCFFEVYGAQTCYMMPYTGKYIKLIKKKKKKGDIILESRVFKMKKLNQKKTITSL